LNRPEPSMVVEMFVPTTVTVTGVVAAAVAKSDGDVDRCVMPLTVPLMRAPFVVAGTPRPGTPEGDVGEKDACPPQAVAKSASRVQAETAVNRLRPVIKTPWWDVRRRVWQAPFLWTRSSLSY